MGPFKGYYYVKKKVVCNIYSDLQIDHTRLCWIYLMSEKSEVEKLFKVFYNMIENQFQTKISILRSNNGTEYFNKVLTNFFQEKVFLINLHVVRPLNKME